MRPQKKKIMQDRKKLVTSLFPIFALMTASFLCLLGTIFLLMQTQPVKGYICRLAEDMAPEGQSLQVNGLGGILPFHIFLAEFSYSDRQGPVIHIQNLEFRSSVQGLLQGRIDISYLGLEKVRLFQIPSKGRGQGPEKGPWQLPELPLMVVKRLDLPFIAFDKDLLGQSAVFSLQGRCRVKGRQHISGELDLIRKDTRGLRANIKADYHEGSGRLDLEAGFSSPPKGLLLRNVPLTFDDRLKIQLQGKGRLDDWQGRLKMSSGSQDILATDFEIGRQVTGCQLKVKGNISPSPLLPENYKSKIQSLAKGLDFDLDLAWQKKRQIVTFKKCRLSLPPAEIDFNGTWRLDDSRLNISSSLEIPRLSEFKPVIGRDMAGELYLLASVKGPVRQPRIKGEAKLKEFFYSSFSLKQNRFSFSCLFGPKGLNSPWPRLDISVSGDCQGIKIKGQDIFGQPVSYGLDLKLFSGREIRIDQADILTQGVTASLKGDIKTDGSIRAELDVNSSSLNQIPYLKTSGLNGKIQIETILGGNLKRNGFSIRANGQITDLSGLCPQIDSIVGQEIKFETDNIVRPQGLIEINNFRVIGQNFQVLSQGLLNLANEQKCRINWQLSGLDLALLNLGQLEELTGDLKAKGLVQGPIRDPRLEAEAEISRLGLLGLAPSTAVISADIEGLTDRPKARIGFQLSRKGERIILDSDLSLGRQRLKVSNFRVRAPHTDLQGQGSFMLTPKVFQGDLHGQADSLAWIESFGFSPLPGRASLDFFSDGPFLKANLEISDVDLRKFPLIQGKRLQGMANVNFQAKGNWESPQLHFSVQAKGVKPVSISLPPASVALTGDLNEQGLNLQLMIKDEQDLDIQGKFSLPLRFRLRPLALQLPKTVKGDLSADLDLENIIQYLDLPGQSLDGKVHSRLSLSGRITKPEIQGSLEFENGRYENVLSGTILENIQLDVGIKNNVLDIQNLTALDGEKGKITGSGEVELASFSQIDYKISLSMDRAKLARLDTVEASVNGQLKVVGSLDKADIKGQLTIFPAKIRIPEPGPQKMDDFEVVNIQSWQSRQKHINKKTNQSYLSRCQLDIEVSIPNGLYVRGQGIDSEWRGRIHLTGTGRSPHINGDINLVEGEFSFLGENFELKKGQVRFTGAYPPDPILDMTAVQEKGDFTLMVNLSGSVSNIDISLESEPPYPQEEILSRFLFNRELSQITPVQAVQLALALKTLATGGSGVGVMGRIRQMLSVDELEIQQAEGSGGTVLGVGKYVNQDVYFKAEKTLADEGGKIIVDIELSPRFSLETEVGSTNMGGEIQWTFRY